MIGKRPRGFYCTREERAAIGARAAAAGLSVSRLVLDLVHDDMADGAVLGLAAEEMAELLDGLRVVVAFVRDLPDQAEDAGALQPTGSGAGGREDGETADGPSPPERVRLSISATDEEWAAVHEQALRRGLSRSRYLVGLLLPDAGLNTAPLPALSGVEQREVLDAAAHAFAAFRSGSGLRPCPMPKALASPVTAGPGSLAAMRPPSAAAGMPKQVVPDPVRYRPQPGVRNRRKRARPIRSRPTRAPCSEAGGQGPRPRGLPAWSKKRAGSPRRSAWQAEGKDGPTDRRLPRPRRGTDCADRCARRGIRRRRRPSGSISGP